MRGRHSDLRLASALLVVTLVVPLPSKVQGAASPVRAMIGGDPDTLEREALAPLRDGDGVILLAPGLGYYQLLTGVRAHIRVAHVTPGRQPIGQEQLDAWRKSVSSPAQPPLLDNGTIRARIGNADVSVVSLAGIVVPADRCVVILDPEFLFDLYENEVRGGLVDLSMKLYRTLADRNAVGFPLFVIDPLSKPSFPMDWAYAGALWEDIWRRPAAFREEIPERWRLRREAEVLAGFGQFEAAADRLDAARPFFPKDGSIDFQLARMAFLDRDIQVGIRFLNRAAKADPRFLRGFSEFGAHLVSRERIPAAEMVFRAGLRVRPDDPALNAGLANLLFDRAESERTADPDGARRDLAEAATLWVPEAMKNKARTRLEELGVPPPK